MPSDQRRRKLFVSYFKTLFFRILCLLHSEVGTRQAGRHLRTYFVEYQKYFPVYESMLIDGKGSINDIDAFFVTAPPARTTLAPKRFGDNELPDFVKVSEGSVKEDEKLVLDRPQRAPTDLKLVKLPPQPMSTVAPFKHNSVSRKSIFKR